MLLAPTVSVIAGNLPGSGSPRMAKAMHANQSVASDEDGCSHLSDFFAKRYPESQSQRLWKLQLSQYPEWGLIRVTEGRCFGKGCGGGGEKGEEQWKTGRKRGSEGSSKHEMSGYQWHMNQEACSSRVLCFPDALLLNALCACPLRSHFCRI